MAKTVDISSKRLAGIDATGFVRWLTGDAHARADVPLTNELQFISRATDVLLKVHSAHDGEYLVAIEIQFWPDPKMSLRMRAYAALIEAKYELPVYSVLIQVKEPEKAKCRSCCRLCQSYAAAMTLTSSKRRYTLFAVIRI